jgi:hypothetical protein
MHAAIVTVFNEYYNYGSFLQAFALQTYLNQHQIEVDMIEVSSFSKKLKKCKRILTKNPSRLLFNLKNAITYMQINKQLHGVNCFDQTQYDAVILGSDEIWNLNNRTFDHSPIYFGGTINAKKRISYAPSANGMTGEDFLKRPEECKLLKSIEYLSARDHKSVALVNHVTQREVTEVLDPTFLIDWTPYEVTNTPDNYVLVYCYGLTNERLKAIESLALKLKAEVIIVGHYFQCKYKVYELNPFKFLGYIKHAKAIVTDSFHGTILSIQYNKEFCSYAGHNYKVSSVLETFSLQQRNATTLDDLSKIFEYRIDYQHVNAEIDSRKAISKTFLKNALALNHAN